MVLGDNLFVESFVIETEKEHLTEADKAEYHRPFPNPGEDRRPTLTWPRQIPLDGSPSNVAALVSDFSDWLRNGETPKLWIKGEPGFITGERLTAFCRALKNQTEARVKGVHFLRESSRREIGEAVADFVRQPRS